MVDPATFNVYSVGAPVPAGPACAVVPVEGAIGAGCVMFVVGADVSL